MKDKLIILDRDGVINEDSDNFIRSADEWQPIPGSIEAIARLHKAGYRIAVASNQSGIGRGLFDETALKAMHEKMVRLVREAGGEVDGIFVCPHAPNAGCDCRKPKSGLLKQVARDFDHPVTGLPFVGDSKRDLMAAREAGCQPVLVLTGKGQGTQRGATESELRDVTVFSDLAAFAEALLDTDCEAASGNSSANTQD